jgi:hypothetical protein
MQRGMPESQLYLTSSHYNPMILVLVLLLVSRSHSNTGWARGQKAGLTCNTFNARLMSPFDNLNKAAFPLSVILHLFISDHSLRRSRYVEIKHIQTGGSEEQKEEEGRKKKNPPLILNNLINFFLNLLLWQRREPKSCTSRLNSRSDFINVVAENTESDVFRVGLDYCLLASFLLLLHLLLFLLLLLLLLLLALQDPLFSP